MLKRKSTCRMGRASSRSGNGRGFCPARVVRPSVAWLSLPHASVVWNRAGGPGRLAQKRGCSREEKSPRGQSLVFGAPWSRRSGDWNKETCQVEKIHLLRHRVQRWLLAKGRLHAPVRVRRLRAAWHGK